ncbi:hypothetical protein ORV05_16310 [Amycolatopsis cynarae]|uniref:Lipoprotein n=1 Tax=Amycolatopsis cynarae TaxID=2995223 RepID=A0ABY7BAT1_9PSEU|nr:hypothetical protein [Amycolatopsis sp. HUAS 11-8]WAL69261.1 hypothetical protein ORV05_16310 [Amycolatopsis sp. HUAS 11-8]
MRVRRPLALALFAVTVGGCGNVTGPHRNPALPGGLPSPPSQVATGGQAWAEQAENACQSAFSRKGRSPVAQSGDSDDQAALDGEWAAGVQNATVTVLAALPGAPAEGAALVRNLRQIAALNTELAGLHGRHVLFDNRADQATTDLIRLQAEIAGFVQNLGTPSCKAIADL